MKPMMTMDTKKDLLDRKTLFNELVNNTIIDKEDYLTKLITCAKENDYISEDEVNSFIENFENQVLLYVINKEKIDDYDIDIENVRKKRIMNIMYSLDNYLLEFSPYDALYKFININNEFIEEAIKYYNNYKEELINKTNEIIKLTRYEYDNNVYYKNGIDALKFMINTREDTLGERNLCMHTKIPKGKCPLYIHKDYINNLLIESRIINKFDLKSRINITNSLNKRPDISSICEAMLINYSLLSIYSDTPWELKVSDNMLSTLTEEIVNGTVTIEELDGYIINGKIKFDEEELEYIKTNFNKVIMNSNNTLDKGLFIKIL